MSNIQPAVHWIRENAAVLALSVAVLTFVGGALSGLGAAVWYLSTLATTEHVDATVREALEPLHELKETVESLDGTVGELRETVAGLEGLRGTVVSLETSVRVLGGTVETLSGMVSSLNTTVQDLDGSVDALNLTFPLLMSCVIELHGPWVDGDGVDARPYRRGGRYEPGGFGEPLELPRVCSQVSELMNPQAASGR